MMEERQSFGKARHMRHIKIIQNPKLNGEQRPLGFKTVCKGTSSDTKEGVSKECQKWRKTEETFENILYIQYTMICCNNGPTSEPDREG